MTNETQHTAPALRLLLLITTPKLAEKAVVLFDKGRVPLRCRMHAMGTASSELLEMLGLGGTERVVLLGLLPRTLARKMLAMLQDELRLVGTGNGVAFTAAISGASSLLFQMLTTFGAETAAPVKERDGIHMTDTRHSMILAIVDQGCSELVMEAARPAGATGGTVINSRWLPDEETIKFWNISVRQEKEIVLILTDEDKKHAIMQAIAARCGAGSEAHGVVASLPVDDVIGR